MGSVCLGRPHARLLASSGVRPGPIRPPACDRSLPAFAAAAMAELAPGALSESSESLAERIRCVAECASASAALAWVGMGVGGGGGGGRRYTNVLEGGIVFQIRGSVRIKARLVREGSGDERSVDFRLVLRRGRGAGGQALAHIASESARAHTHTHTHTHRLARTHCLSCMHVRDTSGVWTKSS